MILNSGVNNKTIFKTIKNIPMITKQKSKIAIININLKAPSPILYKINNKIFYLHNVNQCISYPLI